MCSLPIHSSTFPSSYLYNFLNWSDLIVSLYWGLNLFDSICNRPSKVLHVSFSVVINVSKYWRPFLPNQCLATAKLPVCGVLYMDKTLLTYNLNVFNALYWYAMCSLCPSVCHSLDSSSSGLSYCSGDCFIHYLFWCHDLLYLYLTFFCFSTNIFTPDTM